MINKHFVRMIFRVDSTVKQVRLYHDYGQETSLSFTLTPNEGKQDITQGDLADI